MGRATSGRDAEYRSAAVPGSICGAFCERIPARSRQGRTGCKSQNQRWLLPVQPPRTKTGFGSWRLSQNQRWLLPVQPPRTKTGFLFRYAKLGAGTTPQHQTETLWPWSEPHPCYHGSARRRVARSIRSQSRDARFDGDTPDLEPAIRTWLNLMAFLQFKQLQPSARA